MKLRFVVGTILVLALATAAYAAEEQAEFERVLANVVSRLDREASADVEAPVRLADLVRQEYGTAEEELNWAVQKEMSWGEIVPFAYIQATTGRSFADMYSEEARRDFWSYAEIAGMSWKKMAHSLEKFVKRAERERNSEIFERLRVSRRVHPLPDLGSGFGLFQEALDFRRIDSPRPTKIHLGVDVLSKGKQ